MKKFVYFFVILFMLLQTSCIYSNDSYALKVNNESINQETFKFYFLLSQNAYEDEGGGTDIWRTTISGMKAEEVAKERALQSLLRVKISCNQAEAFGVSLEAEDTQKAQGMLEDYKQILGDKDLSEIGINDKQMLQIMKETILYGKVYAFVTANIEISESEFSQYFEEHIKDPKSDLRIDDDLLLLRDILYEQYAEQVMNDVFVEQYSIWEQNTKIVKNEKVLESIHILEH